MTSYRFVLFGVLISLFNPLAYGQNLPVIHWINRSGQRADTVLNSGTLFVTDYKGSNDVTITRLTGSLNSIYSETYGGPTPGNNPSYVTNFIGVATNGTGDGTAGKMSLLETTLAAVDCSFQFDFVIPLTPKDHFLLSDVDAGEKYSLQAYLKAGSTYQLVSLTNWTCQFCSGQTGLLPNGSWPIWDAANGTLTASSSAGLNEPLVILTPDRTIDRVVLNKLPVGSGSLALQFLEEPPLEITTVGIATNYFHFQLNGLPGQTVIVEACTNLTAPLWLPLQTNTLGTNQSYFTATNWLKPPARFYRLHGQ